MRVNEAVNKIDDLKPNTYSQDNKVKWLSNLDGIIKKEIIDTHQGGENINFSEYDVDKDFDKELLVPFPYDDLYIKWLEAQIDYANGEYGKYSNSMIAFNSSLNNYKKYYNRNNLPISKRFKYI